jgi:ribosome-associated protein YbcJ (S4-like RNA binding protein)
MVEELQKTMAELQAALLKGQAMKVTADASFVKLEGFLKALEVANSVAMNPQVVAAADALVQEAQAPGIQKKIEQPPVQIPAPAVPGQAPGPGVPEGAAPIPQLPVGGQ